MKKLLCLLLVVASVLCVASCGEEPIYEPGTEFFKSTTIVYYTKTAEATLHYYDEDGNNVASDVYAYNMEEEEITDTLLATFERKFDAEGRVTEIKKTEKATGKETITNYAYNVKGDVAAMTEKVTENGESTTVAYVNLYDAKGRLSATNLTMGTDVYTRTYTYIDDTLNCEFIDFDGSLHRLTYNDDGEVFVKYSKTTDAETEAVTETTEKYYYEYKTDNNFAKYGNEKTVCTFMKTYDEWNTHISTTIYMYDRYGNLSSVKTIDPAKAELAREVHVYTPERPTKG